MELGHNITHGQWDWMNDPEIHSNTWEWDMAGPSSQWRYSHNYRHHAFTNVIGMDDDLGYGVLRVSRDQEWRPSPLIRQFWHTVRTICKLSLPDRFLTATSDDAPETASEERFRAAAMHPQVFGAHDVGTRRRGLETAITDRAGRRMKRSRLRPTSLRAAAIAALRSY
jgi:hypothetical protein